MTPDLSIPQQGILPMFSALETRAREQAWQSQITKKEKRKLQLRSRPAPLTDAELNALALPLFGKTDTNDLLVGDFLQEDESIVVSSEKEISFDEQTPWTEKGEYELHYMLLERSLEYLAARGNASEKIDVLNWIFHPETPEQVTKTINGRPEVIHVPFTFGTCCALQGLNADDLRDQIAAICRKSGIAIH